MSTQTEKSTVERLISAYAEAINEGNRDAITTFYTEDGLLIPEGFKPVPRGKSSAKYFTKTGVNISFSVKEVVVEGSYAFVEARASTRFTDSASNKKLNKNSRDLFILKAKEGEWKIYRYIFNSEN